MDLLHKEQDLLGSRYVTRAEILATCDIVARGEVWPLVTDVRPLEEAEAVHARVERGEVIGTGGAADGVALPASFSTDWLGAIHGGAAQIPYRGSGPALRPIF